MLITAAVAARVQAGEVSVQFRRWNAPRVKVGGMQTTSAGVLEFTTVTAVDEAEITENDARRAGFDNRTALIKWLNSPPRRSAAKTTRSLPSTIYRIELRWASADPRVALREVVPDEPELQHIAARLARWDQRATGAWTTNVLRWIAANPEVGAKHLAAQRAVELAPLKVDIRKLKSLGLTRSHDVGYSLSPRGVAYLLWVDNSVELPSS